MLEWLLLQPANTAVSPCSSPLKGGETFLAARSRSLSPGRQVLSQLSSYLSSLVHGDNNIMIRVDIKFQREHYVCGHMGAGKFTIHFGPGEQRIHLLSLA